MKTTSSLLLATTRAAFSSVAALAQTASAPAMSGETKVMQSASSEMTEGEVRKIDKDTKKITLKDGEIKNLGMPGMTMVFQVKDPAMLDPVKAGDKVKLNGERAGGAMVVTHIERAE